MRVEAKGPVMRLLVAILEAIGLGGSRGGGSSEKIWDIFEKRIQQKLKLA